MNMSVSRKMNKFGRTLLLQVLYTLVLACFFLYVEKNYGTSLSFEKPLFLMFLCGAGCIVWALGPAVAPWLMFIYGGIFTAYLVAQSCYLNAFHSYFRLNTVKDLASEVLGAKESAAEFITLQDKVVLISWLVIQVIFIILYFRYEKGAMTFKKSWALRLAGLALLIPAYGNLRAYQKEVEDLSQESSDSDSFLTAYYVYDRIPSAPSFVNKFGLLSFAYRDTEIFLTPAEEADVDSMNAHIESFMQTRASQETNEYTGIFAGKNAFFIQAESLNRAALDPDLTPTLWKMYTEGLRVEGFNTPALPGSTSDTEFMANVSLIPQSEGHAVCYKYAHNTYPQTLASVFESAGYVTTAYHNNYGLYYNRTNTMPAYGFDEFYDCTGLGLQDTSADSEVMEKLKYMYTGADYSWMAYWITYSGHQPYTLDETGVNAENVAKVKEKYPDLSEPYVSYFAKNMDLDQALETFMETMRQAGKLDDVVFIVFGDHSAKGLDFTSSSSFYDETGLTPDESMGNTELFFYCTSEELQETFKRTGTCLDLLPTVANLWGFQVDTHQMLGRDIFDPDYHGFFFDAWGDWETDDYMYSSVKDEWTMKTDGYDLSLAEEEIYYYMEMLEVSSEILSVDYFGNGKGIELQDDLPTIIPW